MQINEWWEHTPEANILLSVLTARPWFVALRVIGAIGGQSLDTLTAMHGAEWLDTLTATADDGSKQFIWRMPPNRAGYLYARDRFGKGLHLSPQIIAPPSVTQQGAWRWDSATILPPLAVPEEPQTLRDLALAYPWEMRQLFTNRIPDALRDGRKALAEIEWP